MQGLKQRARRGCENAQFGVEKAWAGRLRPARCPALWLLWLDYAGIAHPALMRQFDALYGDCISSGIEIGQSHILANPGSVDDVGEDDLPRLIQQFDPHVLAEF